METGFAFRKEMHELMGIPQQPAPPKKVLFMLRDNNRRKFHNLDEMVKMTEAYNLSYRCWPCRVVLCCGTV
jgi:hypothetical protein